jgi:hypothetical protein
LIQPESVIGCDGDVPWTIPLMTECSASVLLEFTVPWPVIAPPKLSTKPLAALRVPLSMVVKLPIVAGPLLSSVIVPKPTLRSPP